MMVNANKTSSSPPWRHAWSFLYHQHGFPSPISILAAFHIPLRTHLQERKWIYTPDQVLFNLRHSLLSKSSWLSLVMDKPPRLFVAGISKLGRILYLHWRGKVWGKKRPLVIDHCVSASAAECGLHGGGGEGGTVLLRMKETHLDKE